MGLLIVFRVHRVRSISPRGERGSFCRVDEGGPSTIQRVHQRRQRGHRSTTWTSHDGMLQRVRTSEQANLSRQSGLHEFILRPLTRSVFCLSVYLFACLSLAVCLCLLLGWAYSCPCSPVGQMYVVQ